MKHESRRITALFRCTSNLAIPWYILVQSTILLLRGRGWATKSYEAHGTGTLSRRNSDQDQVALFIKRTSKKRKCGRNGGTQGTKQSERMVLSRDFRVLDTYSEYAAFLLRSSRSDVQVARLTIMIHFFFLWKSSSICDIISLSDRICDIISLSDRNV